MVYRNNLTKKKCNKLNPNIGKLKPNYWYSINYLITKFTYINAFYNSVLIELVKEI